MIFFCEHGQLGNQVFQYSALRTLAPGERLVLFGFDALQDVFEGVCATTVFGGYGLSYRLAKRLLPFFESAIRWTRLCTLVNEDNAEGANVSIRRGLFSGVKYCSMSFFQSSEYFTDEAIAGLTVKAELLREAEQTLADVLSEDEVPIFVHIRRGDYLHWPSRSEPAVLPFGWYRDSMNELAEQVPNVHFVLCTDDVPYAEDLFSECSRTTIASKSLGHDFALMTLCQGGILSASSFAWWAAYFARKDAATESFIAPLYWAGHRSGKWFPPQIESGFLSYRPVEL